MVIISKKHLKEFVLDHPDAEQAILRWYEIVKKADWSNFAEMRRNFNSVDSVGNDRFIFNIKGNQYRLIAMIFFDKRTVFIRFMGTHRACDKLENISII